MGQLRLSEFALPQQIGHDERIAPIIFAAIQLVALAMTFDREGIDQAKRNSVPFQIIAHLLPVVVGGFHANQYAGSAALLDGALQALTQIGISFSLVTSAK